MATMKQMTSSNLSNLWESSLQFSNCKWPNGLEIPDLPRVLSTLGLNTEDLPGGGFRLSRNWPVFLRNRPPLYKYLAKHR